MDLAKTIETPYNNAVALLNRANELLLENNVKDSTGNEIAQLEMTPANPAWLFALACGSLHTSWQEQIAKAYAALDPQSCEDDQVLVLAALAGIQRSDGTPSHVTVRVSNTSLLSVTIPIGSEFSETYSNQTWATDKAVTLAAAGEEGDSATVALYTVNDGAFSIPSGTEFSSDISGVSCVAEAASYEGAAIEAIASLRNRISQGEEQSDFLKQAKTAIESLPGIESCSLWFNGQVSGNITVGGVTIPPRECYVSIKGTDITGGLAEKYYSYLDVPASAGSLESTCRLGMQDMTVHYDAAAEREVEVWITIRASDAAAGAAGAYKEAVLEKSGSLGAGENVTAQMVSEWVANLGYGTVIGCNVSASDGITSSIKANEFVTFTKDGIHIVMSNAG